MQKLIWTNAKGDSVDLTSGHYGITNWEGFSNTSLNIQTQQVPFQDGGVFLDALMEQRELTVTLAMNDEGSLETRYRLRRELIHILNPKLGEGYLIYKNDFTQKRIKCVPQIPLFETHNSNDSGTPKASLSWAACEPYWEDLEDIEVVFNILKQPTITNNGDIPCQMEIEFFTNGVVNPQVTNITQNQVIKYNGTLSENLDINTNVGKKTVTTEQLKYVSNDCLANFKKVVASDSLFVAITKDKILTSSDSKVWTEVNSGEEGESIAYFNDIIYIESKDTFIVVGYIYNDKGFMLSSPDGINWTEIHSLPNKRFQSIGYSEEQNKYIISHWESNNPSNINGLDISTDGINWTTITVNYSYKSIIYIEELHYWFGITTDVSMPQVYRSSDGETWSFNTSGTLLSYSKINNLLLCAYGGSSIRYSSDSGDTWTSLDINLSSYTGVSCLYYCEEKNFFIWTICYNYSHVDNDLHYRVSPDGINWSDIQTLSEAFVYEEVGDGIKSFVYFKRLGYLIGVGSISVISTMDGLEWKKINPLLQLSYGWNWDSLTYSEKLSLFCGALDTEIFISPDGINWQSVYNAQHSVGKDIIYAKSIFIQLGGEEIYISVDGINWTRHALLELNKYGLAYSETEDLFFMSGGQYMGHFVPKILSSPDGINWTTVYIGENTYNLILMGITCSNTTIVAVGGVDNYTGVYNALIVTSTDGGVSWTEIPYENKTFKSVAYSKLLNLFVAVGYAGELDNLYGIIYTSVDGIIWTEIEIETESLYKIMYSDSKNLFVAVGANKTIITSSDGVNWTLQSVTNAFENYFLNCAVYSKKLDMFLLCGNHSWTVKSETELKENKIQNISADSDMNMNLQLGDNKFRLNKDSGDFSCRIKYRQKYIGV